MMSETFILVSSVGLDESLSAVTSFDGIDVGTLGEEVLVLIKGIITCTEVPVGWPNILSHTGKLIS